MVKGILKRREMAATKQTKQQTPLTHTEAAAAARTDKTQKKDEKPRYDVREEYQTKSIEERKKAFQGLLNAYLAASVRQELLEREKQPPSGGKP